MRKIVVLTALACLAAAALVRITADGPPDKAVETAIDDQAPPSESALARYLGFGHHPDAEERLYEAEERRRQRLIAACMAQHGFDYWPRPVDEVSTDPNLGYRRSLSTAQSQDYWVALTGRHDQEGITAAEMERLDLDRNGRIDFEERANLGCLGRAEHAVPGVFHVHTVLRTELRELETAIRKDPRTIEAHAAYVRCMNSLGIEGATIDEVRSGLVDSALVKQSPVPDTGPCESQLDLDVAAVRASAEEQFADAHREVIERYAVPAP